MGRQLSMLIADNLTETELRIFLIDGYRVVMRQEKFL